MLVTPIFVSAQRGCCSHHGGVAGCNSEGRQICNDGTLSPTCRCTPVVRNVYGCTDSSANNYNPNANKDDGTCEYQNYGCTDPDARNYDRSADIDDDSCEYYVYGCTDSEAINYDDIAEIDNDSCIYELNEEMLIGEDENINDDNKTDDASGFLSVLTIGSAGAGIYYYKKKKSNK